MPQNRYDMSVTSVTSQVFGSPWFFTPPSHSLIHSSSSFFVFGWGPPGFPKGAACEEIRERKRKREASKKMSISKKIIKDLLLILICNTFKKKLLTGISSLSSLAQTTLGVLLSSSSFISTTTSFVCGCGVCFSSSKGLSTVGTLAHVRAPVLLQSPMI